ncbi:MAG: hypothetical protein JNL74_17035 [Fibrobacteres bacterium]|nr:hypothetical protein [Fibrobacterota bacterium]
MNNYIFDIVPLITGIISLSMAIVSYRKEAPFRLNRRFFTLSLSIAVWNLGLYYQESLAASDSARIIASKISHLGAAFAAPTGLHFIFRFVRHGNMKLMIPIKASYLLSIVIAVLLFSGNFIIAGVVSYKYGTHCVWGFLYPVHLLNIVFDYTIMLILLIGAYKKSSSNVERNRLHYVLIGAVITIITTLCNFLPAAGVPIKAPGHLGTLIFQIMILMSMYRYRLMNLSNAVSKILYLLLTWLIIGGGFVVILYFTDKIVWKFITAGIFVAFFFSVQKLVLPVLERRIYPLKADTKQLLESLDKSLTLSEKPKDAAESLVNTVHNVTNVPSVAVYIKRGGLLRRMAASGSGESDFPEVISESSLLCKDVSYKIKEELKRDVATEQWGTRSEREVKKLISDMDESGIEAAVPIEAEGVLYGLLAFSRKRFGGVYDPEDLNTFRLLAGRTAVALAIQASSAKLAEREHLAEIGEMTAMIAHEIKNPLGAIKGAAEQMEGRNNDSESLKLSAMIKEEALRLEATIRTYLAFARPVSVSPEDVDVVKLAGRCSELFMNEAKSSLFSVGVDKVNPIKINIDPDGFRQIFFNIAKNSLEAKSDGSLKISFYDSADSLSVIFEDNCGGMTPETVEKLYKPFYTTKANGTGLGMAVCRKIAAAMNSKLSVSSKQGVGTKFVLEINRFKEIL